MVVWQIDLVLSFGRGVESMDALNHWIWITWIRLILTQGEIWVIKSQPGLNKLRLNFLHSDAKLYGSNSLKCSALVKQEF